MSRDPFDNRTGPEPLAARDDTIKGDAFAIIILDGVTHVFAHYADFKAWQDERRDLPLSAYRYRGVISDVKLYGYKVEQDPANGS